MNGADQCGGLWWMAAKPRRSSDRTSGYHGLHGNWGASYDKSRKHPFVIEGRVVCGS